jgi:hypothetical protein
LTGTARYASINTHLGVGMYPASHSTSQTNVYRTIPP